MIKFIDFILNLLESCDIRTQDLNRVTSILEEAKEDEHLDADTDIEDITGPITSDQKEKIMQIINVFETGTKHGDYAMISIYRDGKNNSKQITFGRSQTTEQGNLKELLQMYIDNNGQYANQFKEYMSMVGRTSLVSNKNFINLLKKSGDDIIMRHTQDQFFDKVYWNPAVKWFTSNGFTNPLSMLVIYDSFIHSGRVLGFLRKRFKASPPAKGGSEAEWITQYMDVRHRWLSNHSRPILRKTTYRTKAMKRAIDKGDWKLEDEFNANGTKIK